MSLTISEKFTPDNKKPVTLEDGDICIAASYSVGEVDIRRNSGAGRVLVFDRELNAKGALWTGEEGLVIGLEYCPLSRTLLVSDVSSQTVKRFSRAGDMLPSFPDMQGKPFGVMAAAPDGTIVIGEHIKGDKFPFLGGGEIYKFAADGSLLHHFAAEHDPGKFGFHGVTNLALAEGGNRAIYISETGKRVMQYDLAGGQQLDDLYVLAADGEKSTSGLAMTADGRILLATVTGAGLYSPTGEVIKEYDIPHDRGWSAVRISVAGDSFFIANFFTGRLEKRDLATGEILEATDTGLTYRLASIAEIS